MFEYYKTIGKQYNPTLMARDKIESGQQVDRMIALRFNAPEEEINSRKNLVMTIEDVDGAKAEIKEKR